MASLESCKVGQDVFCNGTCKDYRNVDPSCIVLTNENREQADRIARVLEARLKQVQENALSSDEDEPPHPEFGHHNLFDADPPGFLGHLSNAKDRHYFSDGILHMVELFAGVGAFGTGWRRLGNTVIDGCEWNKSLNKLLLERNAHSLALISTRIFSMLGALCSTRTNREYTALAEGLNVHHSQALTRSRVPTTLKLLRSQA